MSQKKAWIIFVVVFTITVGLGIYVFTTVSNNTAMLDADNLRISQLKSDIDSVDANKQSEQNSVVSETTGVSADRVYNDTQKISDLLKVACTWSSFSAYNAAREMLISDYGVSESSVFLSEFMPEVTEYTNNKGEIVNDIDLNNMNMFFSNISPHLVSVDLNADVYDYFAIVTVGSKVDQDVSGETHIAVTYSVDKDGNISNIDAILLAN